MPSRPACARAWDESECGHRWTFLNPSAASVPGKSTSESASQNRILMVDRMPILLQPQLDSCGLQKAEPHIGIELRQFLHQIPPDRTSLAAVVKPSSQSQILRRQGKGKLSSRQEHQVELVIPNHTGHLLQRRTSYKKHTREALLQ